ncbi:phosphatidate cytidylyltransferase [Insulibacter thermoxylanivorax]|uniref:Phosphatidate cytidylyltransferase n=1 Tax=Insulibacter thermoxylanivorax TaxID=2749268 RepID=A0A916QDP9_9BACL|nr:phosphatidate cytidylyltransferase [Insulibacter thermoxylanivorax]GFR37694.1 phosphatidate cytidylyltransferase [Insulibacter thermoxylanivorax]
MKQRIITGVIAVLVFVGMLVWGGYAYQLLIALMAAIGFYEFARMNRIQGLGSGVYAGYIAVIGLTLPLDLMWPDIPFSDRTYIWFTVFILLLMTVFFHHRTNLHRIAVLLVGVLYIGYGFRYMIVTRMLPEDGLLWSLFIFGCIWLTDSGAYFSGMLLGRHKLAPKISPKKTIEGAIGGIAVAVLFAFGFALFNPDWIGAGQAMLLGAFIAVLGQLGDLIQSAYKRLQGVKDSGKLFPGHGGILDRVDSWLIVFPAIHLLGLL